MNKPTPSRYQWEYKGVSFDFYRLCEILDLKSEPQKHAIKKLIRAGQSVKSSTQDIDEAIDALQRWKEMIEEDGIGFLSNIIQTNANETYCKPMDPT